jgi:flagellar hook-associated protein 1 FlgK
MPSTFGGFELAKRALFAQQAAMTTTGHNIANASTKGFSRQIVHMVAARPMEAPGMSRSNAPGMMGQGVEFDTIQRVRDSFLDDQFASENKYYGEWTMRRQTLDKIEIIMSESADSGLSNTFEAFWNSWQELSKEPDKLTSRTVIVERALTMTNALNHISQQLTNYASDMNENVRVKTGELNRYVANIANLNEQIFRVEGLSQNANDLRDQRDLLVDELSRLVNVAVQRTPNGYNITMGNVSLVNRYTAGGPFDEALLLDAYNEKDLKSGELYGMLLGKQETIPEYQKQLDTMVKAMVEGEMQVTLPAGSMLPEGTILNGVTYTGANRMLPNDLQVTVKGINGLHRLGYTLDPTLTQGNDFFTLREGFTAFSAASITVNPVIASNPKQVASSMRTTTVGTTEKTISGNGDLARLIAGVRNEKIQFETTGTGEALQSDETLDGFYRALIGNIGVRGQEAIRQSDIQKVIIEQVDGRRQSISGVSLDEEMSGLIKFQHAYNAAARLMTTYDEMLDKLINGMGTVGR